MPLTNVTPSVNASVVRSSVRLIQARDVPGTERDERVESPRGEGNARTGAGGVEHERLGDQLPHETGAAGAERGADGNLALARRRAGEEQVGHVGARDQQNEADGAEDEQQRACARFPRSPRRATPGASSNRRSPRGTPASRRRAIVVSSACACSTEVPPRRRPATCRKCVPRLTIPCALLRNANGTQS